MRLLCACLKKHDEQCSSSAEMKRKKKRTVTRDPPKHSSGLCQAFYGASQTFWLSSASCVLLSIIAAFYFSARHSSHIKQLHENELWFSHISKLEQEISFRTEAGLYYSYYKQLVEASTIGEGVFGLLRDNTTESLESINTIKRFNIFQEIILAISYRLLLFCDAINIEPVYFYINAVFVLQGVHAFALYCTAWLLSGSTLAIGGVLCFTFFFFNRADATRVEFAIPLRESFALPFVALHILFITVYLMRSTNSTSWKQYVSLGLVCFCGLCVTMFWQFGQFIFLLEGIALVFLYIATLVPMHKAWNLLLCHSLLLLLVCLLQFLNFTLIASLAFNLTIGASIVFVVQSYFAPGNSVRHYTLLATCFTLCKKLVSLLVIGVLTLLSTATLKVLLQVSEDDHVFKFILAKLPFLSPDNSSSDFDSLLYLCEPAFQFISGETVLRLSRTLLLPCYLLTMCIACAVLAVSIWRRVRTCVSLTLKDEMCDGHVIKEGQTNLSTFAFHFVLSVLFGVMAMFVQRFKVLWVPHMCMIAAAGITHVNVKQKLGDILGLGKNAQHIFHAIGIFVLIATIFAKEYPATMLELSELREFYDPDTVQLMQWINSKTPRHAVFAGSMQLMAGVKLCTGRTITNHPHYENKHLRYRTLQVYQIYAQRPPEHVFTMLRTFGIDYIIIENSICYSNASQQCTLTNILDTVSVTSNTSDTVSDTHYQRFCKVVRHYGRFFTHVFQNPTFDVYKLVHIPVS